MSLAVHIVYIERERDRVKEERERKRERTYSKNIYIVGTSSVSKITVVQIHIVNFSIDR